MVCLIIAGYGLALGHRTSLASAGLIGVSCLANAGWRGYCSLRQLAAGIDFIVIGMLLFSLAVLDEHGEGRTVVWENDGPQTRGAPCTGMMQCGRRIFPRFTSDAASGTPAGRGRRCAARLAPRRRK